MSSPLLLEIGLSVWQRPRSCAIFQEPELLEDRTLKCGTSSNKDHPTRELRERYAEHLLLGDSRAAVVVSTNPLMVTAYSDEMDAAILLRFPAFLVSKYALQVGTRLLTVNTYEQRYGLQTRALLCVGSDPATEPPGLVERRPVDRGVSFGRHGAHQGAEGGISAKRSGRSSIATPGLVSTGSVRTRRAPGSPRRPAPRS